MLDITRSKFFVSNVQVHANQHQNDPTCKFKKSGTKIIMTAAYSRDKNTDNYEYWEASPCGQLEMHLNEEDAAQFTLGSYWYIDVEPIENPPVEEKNTEYPGPLPKSLYLYGLMQSFYEGRKGNLEVTLSGKNVTYKVSITNQVVWPLFMNKLGDRYSFKFVPAENN